VLKVLSSKRLLVDHVELIEDSLNDSFNQDSSQRELLTFLKTSGILASTYVVFVHIKQKQVPLDLAQQCVDNSCSVLGTYCPR
jgi:hypothetical protein